ncbi:hypothetical protein INT47_007860 [Mucor saturninus]|uniref:Uncharacterized protein n=1 Tax=Mucor saturninus TaxID=64648 RepID=A0A8H7V3F8_9FUNG|nr:hypothetical protein INT47_007860 [Mucor saturninus]
MPITEAPSFVYDTTSEIVVARGDSANKLMCEYEGLQNNLIYVPNVFIEFHDIYLRSQQDTCQDHAYEALILQEAIYVLHTRAAYWARTLHGSTENCCYTFTVPTNWDYNAREEIIRYLFIKSDLIFENDCPSKLNVFTELETIFRYRQICDYGERKVDTRLGEEYVICSIDFKSEVHVNLNLVISQYPGWKTTDNKFVPQVLSSTSFTISFGLQAIESSLVACLERRCESIMIFEVISPLIEMVTLLLESLIGGINGPYYRTPPDDFLLYQPFLQLPFLYDEQHSLRNTELNIIQALTLEDVFESLSDSVQENYNRGMGILLRERNNTRARRMLFVYGEGISNHHRSIVPLKAAEIWSKKFVEEQKNAYNLITNEDFPISSSYLQNKLDGLEDLVKQILQDHNIDRDPIIIPKDKSAIPPDDSSRSVYFINIDLLPSQIRTTLTYMDDDSKINYTENIECDIQPLDCFFRQSEMYQRQELCVDKKYKTYLENLFGDYLKLYLKSNRKDSLSRQLIYAASKLYNQVLQSFEIKSTFDIRFDKKPTSTCRSKEIRDLFTTSKPDLLENLMGNAESDNLFEMNSYSEEYDTNLVNTCDPGYLFFLMIVYFRNLNNLLKKKLDDKFGNEWRGKSIWYGVSVDKHLLDTVLGSTKKLEKLFYASGILQKNDDLRRAKFCTRGEEILPALQKKLKDLNFKMKSYFVVAQTFSKHVQLTLHQVVRLASKDTDAATIIVQDEIIYINDVYDTLCKEVWKTMEYNCHFDYCPIHKDGKDRFFDFESSYSYISSRQNLKQCIVQLLGKNKEHLDMNSKIKFNTNDECACGIWIHLDLVMEAGLKSVAKNITAIIAASLTNQALFKYYEPKYLFVLGDPFSMSYGSSNHTAYATTVQRAMDDAIQSKENDTEAFVFRDSIEKLLETVQDVKPYMCDSRFNVFPEFMKVKKLAGAEPELYDMIDRSSIGPRHYLVTGGKSPSAQDLIIECKFINYDYSFEISMRRMADYHNSRVDPFKLTIKGEPLTLAYV